MDFLSQSEIRRMTLECQSRGGINLAQGICDTPIPEVVRRAAQRAVDVGPNTYTRNIGIDSLRQQISKKLQRHNQLNFDPETEITVTSGASSAFYGACLTLLEPGSEVILFEPYYGYHVAHLRATGLVPKLVPLLPPTQADGAWTLDRTALKQAISPQTSAIVINTPSNPSGKLFTRDELTFIAGLCEAHNLWVFTDEIYEHFVYDGKTHLSPATLPELADRTVTISGFSKTLSITGWRVGFSAAPAHISERLALVNDLVYICAPAPLQAGVAEGLAQLGDDFYAELANSHQRKRQRICDALDSAGLPPLIPQGAYYVLANTERLPGRNGKDKVLNLLEKTGVAGVAGSAFFEAQKGENWARFCFAKTEHELEQACQRLATLRL